ncbi:MAG: type II secretion system protein [Phycisphaerales bacterium]
MRGNGADIPAGRGAGKARGAFTMLEILVVIGIITVLVSLLIVGMAAARRAARAAGDRQAVSALSQETEKFKDDHSFFPPLVYDGDPLGGSGGSDMPRATRDAGGDGPVFQVSSGGVQRWLVSVWDPGAKEDLEFLRQRNASGEPDASGTGQDAWSDPRYSKFALAYYLAGALPEFVDGIEGEGMLEPLTSGGFRGVGAVVGRGRDRFPSYVDTTSPSTSIEDTYIEESEADEHNGTNPSVSDNKNRFRLAVTDRAGRAYRYYRWEQGNTGNLALGDPLVKSTADMNIPAALLDPELRQQFLDDATTTADLTGGDAELRGAKYAIVGAGPNGVFGTEDLQYIADKLGRSLPTTPEGKVGMRREAWADNVMEVGK